MTINFHKYQGTGNDFILIDDRDESFPISEELVARICDRKFGIGADGLILIQNHPELDYRMVYFNSDGTQSLCGNGSRCGFAFTQSLGMISDRATFETTDGIHEIKEEGGRINFQLFDTSTPQKINNEQFYLNTGSPHRIELVEDVKNFSVVDEGRKIRNLPQYIGQNGTNVNFAQLLQDRVKIRTYERGVEDETLSCGTGATAVGLLAGELGFSSPVRIETEGGELSVSFEKQDDGYKNIWLSGPAEKVFEGSITI
ncbi:MAG: diaminopimelate epimerase [Bacteroidota bacterium]